MNSVRILLVEDSPSDAVLVASLLADEKSFNHTLTHAERLADGLAILAKQAFDVVLSDLGLPDSQGLATFIALHKHAPQLPIVVLTRDNDKELAVEAIKLGAQDYLPKSNFDSFALVRTMNYAIERQRLTQQLRDALENVKTLSGLLPICAGCKKIRDDKGYWNQIETYVSQRSNASFSHGMCSGCAIKFLEEGGVGVPDELRTSAQLQL
jgi:DNA-binding NtrC family response regulator